MIALDLCQTHYQSLLIIFLKFTAKCVEGVKKEKKIKPVRDFIGLKNNKSYHKKHKCEKDGWQLLVGSLKSF